MRVGIVVGGLILPYFRATAVARLRAYDVIELFAYDFDIVVELFVPGRRYDIVIFEKTFTEKWLAAAVRLKRKGVVILLDVNVDYFSRSTPRVDDDVRRVAMEFANIASGVIVPSERLSDDLRARGVHDNIMYVPEPIPERYFTMNTRTFRKVPRLIWCGYYKKAAELLLIQKHLQQVQDTFGAALVVISDRDPNLDLGSYQFIHYRERSIVRDLSRGDLFIAPRQLNHPYKFHHTFSKIGLPMAVGLPVMASAVPSYLASPALICRTDKDWQETLDAVYMGRVDFYGISQEGSEFCRQEFSWDRVRRYYLDVFRSLGMI